MAVNQLHVDRRDHRIVPVGMCPGFRGTIGKVQWFSRHEPTLAQVEDLGRSGCVLVGVAEGRRLGAVDLEDEAAVDSVLMALQRAIEANEATAVAGVPSTPILQRIGLAADYAVADGEWDQGQVPFYSAWNSMRSVDGAKPTFEHKKFVFVGRI